MNSILNEENDVFPAYREQSTCYEYARVRMSGLYGLDTLCGNDVVLSIANWFFLLNEYVDLCSVRLSL